MKDRLDISAAPAWWSFALRTLVAHGRTAGALVLAIAMTITVDVRAGDDEELDDDEPYIARQAIVVLSDGVSISDINDDFGTTTISTIPSRNVYLLALPASLTEQSMEDQLELDPRVEMAELNYEASLSEGTSQGFFFDAFWIDYTGSYAWDQIGLIGAHAVTRGQGAVVAILDTGVDSAHAALGTSVAAGGWDYVADDNDPADIGNGVDDDGDESIDELTGHGTFIAGIVKMIAPDATLLPVRVLDSDGRGTAFRLAQGIYHAIDAGADVVNLSLTSDTQMGVVTAALQAARDAGVVVVAAAGNQGAAAPLLYPAANPLTIAVASSDDQDGWSTFSNFGEHVTLTAPGTEVASTWLDGGYAISDGTSMSTAMVSAAVALLRASDPLLTCESVQDALVASTTYIDPINPEQAGQLGSGRLNVGHMFAGHPSAPVPGDLNLDGYPSYEDLTMIFQSWGDQGGWADIDNDGLIGYSDLEIILINWSEAPPPE